MTVQPGPDAADDLLAGTDAVHLRRIELGIFDADEGLTVVARLRDERPWAAALDELERLHDMVLRVSVRLPDLVITAARAEIRELPHVECRAVEGALEEGLVGLSVARGYTRAVQERFGRELGCAHLELLARLVGPAVIQGVSSSNALRKASSPGGAAPEFRTPALGTCHVWAEDGVGPKKLAIGWRPGRADHPVPSLDELRRRQEAAGSSPATG